MLYVRVSPPDPNSPEALLKDWSVRVTKEGSRHFVGTRTTGGGRVSSAIVEFDTDTMSGRTESGRVYTLFGDAAPDGTNELFWLSWCARNGIDPTKTSVVETIGNASPAIRQ